MPQKTNNNTHFLQRYKNDKSTIEICFRVVDHVDAMLAYWDKNQVCRFANKAYLKWAGKSPNELLGKMKMKEFLGHLYSGNQPYIKKVLAGKKQVFEREYLLPDGSVRHYIATYTPDKTNGKIEGFFVHIADINIIKELEKKLLEAEKAKRREVLRSVIDTQETEREFISYELRDKVNQTLASSKMMLDTADKNKESLLPMISHHIHEAIDELNRISTDLTPTVIIMIGFVAGMKEYISIFEARHHLKIRFNCMDEKIESLAINDKISIFRVIQNYLQIASYSPACKIVTIEVKRQDDKLKMVLQNNDADFKLPLRSKEFIDIEHRLEYYDGTWNNLIEKNKKTLFVELNIPC